MQVDSYRSAYAGILPDAYLAQFSYEEQAQDWRDLLAAETGDLLLVAVDPNGEVMGYALGRRLIDERYDCELAALHVRHDARGQGIGRASIAAVADHFRRQGCRSLVVWTLAANRPARSLYEGLGGQLNGQRQIELSEATFFEEVAYGWPQLESLAGMQRFDE